MQPKQHKREIHSCEGRAQTSHLNSRLKEPGAGSANNPKPAVHRKYRLELEKEVRKKTALGTRATKSNSCPAVPLGQDFVEFCLHHTLTGRLLHSTVAYYQGLSHFWSKAASFMRLYNQHRVGMG